jgi:heme/copper-type cytochrome/quinol oxidase subunit 1
VSAGPSVAPHRPELATDGVRPSRPRWLELALSSDHKDVGRMFVVGALSFLALGLVEFLLIRLQLIVPENTMIEPVTFNRLLSVMTPSVVVFFAVGLAIGLFTYVLPLQVGARQIAFPRLGQFAFWLYAIGGSALYVSFVYTPPEAGFSTLPPLSDTAFIDNNGVDVWTTAIGLATLGFTLQAINLIVTVSKLRAPGLAWRRLPPFTTAGVVSSWVLVIAGPAMLAALTMLEIDRHFDGVFFTPGEGGAPTYYQHLSWIFFTGCYLMMVIPPAGAISEILPALARKPPLSRGATRAAFVAIAVFGLLAWMQNMFTASIPIGWLYMAMAAAILLLIPLGVLFVNWLGTLSFGAIEMRAPMLFALGAISTLSIGLAAELAHSVIPVNWLLADTTDATASSGYVLVGGGVLGGFAALYYWLPKMTGRTAGESLARLSLLLILVGVHLTFIPMVLAGLEGQPVDVYKYFDTGNLDLLNLLSGIGALVLAFGVLSSLVNLALAASRGTPAGPDPWRGDSLEWLASSPPPPHNFDVVPDVRSAEPMRDIRDAVRRREPATGSRSETGEPVA